MKSEQEIKRLFNQALSDMKTVKSCWVANGNNHYGDWYEENKTEIYSTSARLNTLRDILNYYSDQPFVL